MPCKWSKMPPNRAYAAGDKQSGLFRMNQRCYGKKTREMKLEIIARNSPHTVAFLPKESVLINETLQKFIWTLRAFLFVCLFPS